MDLNILKEINEWALYGFYEDENLPEIRRYGRAYRRLYENMPVDIRNNHLLIPHEVVYKGFNAHNGFHHCTNSIINLFHCIGIAFEPQMIEIKKQQYPQYSDFIDNYLVPEISRTFVCRTSYIHSNPDITTIVNKGYNYIKEKLTKELSNTSNSKEKDFLIALNDYSIGIDTYYKRIQDAITKEINKSTGERHRKLNIIKNEWDHTFYTPAKSFIGGLLAVNFIFMLDGADSIGRFDYVLGNLFENDIASGKLSIKFARELLDEMWQIFEDMNGWNLQLGGYGTDGKDACNKLTEEALLCTARNKIIRPNIAFKMNINTPDNITQLIIKSIASGCGKPAIYNDDLYLSLLAEKLPDAPYEDLVMYGFGGCTETMITGKSAVDSLAGTVNTAKVLEETLKQLESYNTYEDFFEDFKVNLTRAIQKTTDYVNAGIIYRKENGDPNLFRSMFTEGCIENHKSFEAGGAKYNWSIISFDGTSVVIDSLYVVKHHVFETNEIPKEKLIAALKANFSGYEDIQNIVINTKKYGNDLNEVDLLGKEFLDHIWSTTCSIKQERDGFFIPSIILFETYSTIGHQVGATPNGRLAQTPLNDSVGAVAGCDTNGPTALFNSVLKQPLKLALGTPVLNIRINKQIIDTENGKFKTACLIKGFFVNGGMQIQISVLDSKEMREAQITPEKYKNLIVRIGGYSAYFINMSKELQDTVIARTEH